MGIELLGVALAARLVAGKVTIECGLPLRSGGAVGAHRLRVCCARRMRPVRRRTHCRDDCQRQQHDQKGGADEQTPAPQELPYWIGASFSFHVPPTFCSVQDCVEG